MRTRVYRYRIAIVGHGDFWEAFTRRVYGQPVRLANCEWVVMVGHIGPSAVLHRGASALREME